MTGSFTLTASQVIQIIACQIGALNIGSSGNDNGLVRGGPFVTDAANIEKGVCFVEFTNDDKKDVIQLIIE